MANEYDIGAAFQAIENELIASMIRNLDRHRAEEEKLGYNWSMWQVEQLKSLENYKKENQARYAGIFKNINGRIKQLLQLAQEDGYMSQEVFILNMIQNGFKAHKPSKGATAEFFRLNERKLNTLIKATTEDMERAEIAVLRRANDQYRKIIYNAQVYANTGAGTYEKAVDMATKDFLQKGIDCIEYKDGSRHTISDYADMAIRTASKRAYLQGEGTKRQEWGIFTVIVNKRGNPCPKCLPHCGKVYIDDVWSGGPSDGKSPVTGVAYPLMSEAIAKGLYHPRCKDVHTTYFEGISTPPKNSPYTREELNDIAEKYRQEQKQKYAKRQAEKYDRMAKHSLDGENQRVYRQRALEWEEVSENLEEDIGKTQESDIMKSDLGKFKQKLLNDDDIDKEYYKALKEKFSHGKLDAKKAFAKFVPMDSVKDAFYENVARYDTNKKKIFMHYGADLRNDRGVGATWFHEHGHLIDDALGEISKAESFLDLLKQDAINYRLAYGRKQNLKTWNDVDMSIGAELNDMRKHSAVSDILGGITKGNIRGCACHSDSYWNNASNITSEAFAHMFEAQFDSVRYEQMKKYFPESLAYFEKKLKEVAK